MKHFVYFEATEGGMSDHDITEELDFSFLRSWMKGWCSVKDGEMVNWAEEAEVGEMFDHRLGCLVRLKDSLL